MLEAIREVDPTIRFYQASSSEIFGEPVETPQNEVTPLAPLTPYGVAKAYGHFISSSYRRRYGLFASCGILYNHESPRRPLDFLPRKVATAAAAISLGLEHELVLGDLDSRRDWGYAGDYVRAMWLMLQQDEPDDYVVATGESHSVQDLVERAFAHVGLEWRDYVRSDPALRRGTAELHHLVGDPTPRARSPRVGAERRLRRARRAPRRRGARAPGRSGEPRVDPIVRAGRLVPGEQFRPGVAPARSAHRSDREPHRRRRRSPAGSSGSNRTAASPHTSGSEPAAAAATGQPHAIASTGGRPKPS